MKNFLGKAFWTAVNTISVIMLFVVWRAYTSPTVTSVAGVSTTANRIVSSATPSTTLDYVNAYREEQGLSVMTEDAILTEMANRRADDMVARQYYSHNSPENLTFYKLMTSEGTAPAAACENLSLTYETTANAPVVGWKNSPSHNDCMLDSRMTRAGYAFRAYGTSMDTSGQLKTHYLVVAIHGSEL